MADPLSIAGAAIAIFDQLLRLGERTARFISDSQSFNEDTKYYYNKLIYEVNRTRQLRHILFEPSPIYGSLTLFENFDEDVQQQIKIFMAQLMHMLQETSDLLEHRYGVSDANATLTRSSSTGVMATFYEMDLPSSTETTSSRTPSLRGSWKTYTRQPLNLLRWSFHDKKRAEELLSNFSDLNSRIHENTKLWCLASSIGLNMQHLQRLQEDEDSIRLGLNVDATLKITASEASDVDCSFELTDPQWIESLHGAMPIEPRLSVVKVGNETYLQEHRPYDGSHDGHSDIDQRTKNRVDSLAKLLQQPKEKVFCIPQCVGWRYDPSKSHITFVFETPEGCRPEPMTLNKLLDTKSVKLTLGQRFGLALALAKCITKLQMVKWVHESFRSENVIFFPAEGGTYDPKYNTHSQSSRIDWSSPYVVGFEFARPELDFSQGLSDNCLERDVYRHPERQGRPGKPFSKIHDIYALGVVLLEIGLWERAITLERNQFRNARDPFVIQAQLLKQAERRIGDKMGEKYRQIVITCLKGDFGVQNDTREELKLQQAFRVQVVDVLERIAGYI